MVTPATLRTSRANVPEKFQTSMLDRQKPALRTSEVAALHPDGSRSVATYRTPCLPVFEAAFSAMARGTVLTTPDGTVAIEDLQPGDWLNTSTGKPAQVLWIGSSSFVPADSGRRVPLVRIMADSFGQHRPSTFITVGPSARLLQTPAHLRADAIGAPLLTPASVFVDNVNIIEVVPPTPVRLFHICLTRHAVVDAGGLAMETFHPGANTAQMLTQPQRELFLSMFPHIMNLSDFGPLAHPRAPDTEAVA